MMWGPGVRRAIAVVFVAQFQLGARCFDVARAKVAEVLQSEVYDVLANVNSRDGETAVAVPVDEDEPFRLCHGP